MLFVSEEVISSLSCAKSDIHTRAIIKIRRIISQCFFIYNIDVIFCTCLGVVLYVLKASFRAIKDQYLVLLYILHNS